MAIKKVLVSLSGGIDSSLTCLLLKEQGYEVIAATFRVYDSIQEGCLEKLKGCCSIESIAEARNFALNNEIQHYILDYREYFGRTVIKNFVEEYLHARTPNPCVLCNYEIKWGKLLEFAESLGCEYIATGHYARVSVKNDRFILSRGIDAKKDQSYFLWMLTQRHLSKTLFPLGHLTKQQVKLLALEKGLKKLTEKKESQEICFVTDGDYRRFITKHVSSQGFREGNFVSTNGKILGKHKGISHYTIGQRKGLGIALGVPHYVKEIRPETNEIVLATYEDLICNEFWVNKVNFVSIADFQDGMIVEAKIRYRTPSFKARIFHDINNTIRVVPQEKVYAVTPGQSAVFYLNDEVLLGGIILQSA